MLRRFTLVPLTVLAVLVPAAAANAADFTIDDLGDAPDADTSISACATTAHKCTLRAAIEQANFNGADTTVDATGVTGTILLGSALPAIGVNMEITGPGATKLAVDGNNAYRGMDIEGAAVTLDGLTVQHGLATGGG